MATTEVSAREKRFDWPLCHEAENFVLRHLAEFTLRNGVARRLEERMREETGTLLLDWVDHLVIDESEEAGLRATGYVEDESCETPPGRRVFRHPEAMLPAVLLGGEFKLTIRCESVADFMVAHALAGEPAGAPLSRYRTVLVEDENDARLEAVERRAYTGFVVTVRPGETEKLLKAMELWRTRPRRFDSDAEGFHVTHALLDRVIALVGRDLACHAVFAEERRFWQSRNRAARVQKARQDRLGLGWANHDHHTFRSSRANFVALMRALEKLGFVRRERYYAGAQAGWGAQIAEQPVEGIVTFCDVDLAPEETEIDFSRQPLSPATKLGTIGLWIGLHGESFLTAGMHHLECRFDYARLREQLAAEGVATMKPFSDFPFLKQAFTEGERWTVDPARAERLLGEGLISDAQCREFTQHGAIGSHLENLQRSGGYKGFNQKSVSAIIAATDPRAQTH